MELRRETYTGFIEYRDINFSFILENGKLKLISPLEKSHEIRFHWIMKEASGGVFTSGDPLIVDEPTIVGKCNETGENIIFFPQVGSIIINCTNLIGNTAPILQISLCAYIVCRLESKYISRLSFSGPEIDYIHPVNQAFSWSYDSVSYERGIIKIETNDFSSTTTKPHSFNIDGQTVISKIGINRCVSTKIGEPPLSIKSTLMFEFEPSNDYGFILKLCRIAKDYVSYLCYRRNICIDEIELSAPYDDGKHVKFASLYLTEDKHEPEIKALKQNRNIKQIQIDEGESRILQDISDNTIYLRHLPSSYETGCHIDASRFIMITAAFEWEFNRMKPDGLPKSESRQLAEQKAASEIDMLISSRTGKEKEIYKFIKKFIGAASLQNKIERACEELDPIVGLFGKRLYSMNNEELIYADMGTRLSDQRNHYAHGDIDKEFIGTSLLDLIFLEYIIYAMQLKYYGVNDENIKKAINELFHLNYAL